MTILSYEETVAFTQKLQQRIDFVTFFLGDTDTWEMVEPN